MKSKKIKIDIKIQKTSTGKALGQESDTKKENAPGLPDEEKTKTIQKIDDETLYGVAGGARPGNPHPPQ